MQNKRGRASTRSMSAIEFEALRPFLTHLSDDRVEAARLALVESDTQTLHSISEKFKVTRQAVNRSVGSVWKVYEAYQASQAARLAGVPEGWLQMFVPAELIPQVQALIDGLQTAPKKRKKPGQ